MRGKTLIILLLSLSFEAGAQAPASLDGLARVIDNSGPEVDGLAKIVDGDTLDVAGQRIRLYGIDAPESQQICIRDGEEYPCGQEATAYLRHLIGQQVVRCNPRNMDNYGRIIAVCFTPSGTDLGEAMVRGGQAIAYRRYSHAYVFEEAAARDERIGLWSGKFTPPWQWRKEQQ